MTPLTLEACLWCKNGLHDECPLIEDNHCCCFYYSLAAEAESTGRGLVGRPLKDANDVTDILSTGRKRAAQLAPIFEGMECEWAGLKYAGGGVVPIMGCTGNTLSESRKAGRGERHHGPDKNVLNNSPGVNLHRICSFCHHRWHALNDEFYDPAGRPDAGKQYLPEAPEGATVMAHDPNTRWEPEEYEEWLSTHNYT